MRRSLWPDSTESEVEDLLGPAPRVDVVVAERDGGGLCGYLELGTREYAEGCLSSPVAYLEGIWVDPDARRTRVASALVEHAVELARAKGHAELASDCDLDNRASRSFHAAAGFSEVQRIVCFRRSLRP